MWAARSSIARVLVAVTMSALAAANCLLGVEYVKGPERPAAGGAAGAAGGMAGAAGGATQGGDGGQGAAKGHAEGGSAAGGTAGSGG